MIAQWVPLEALRGERYFRWRGGDVSRIEGLTDSVFALALTLLIVRADVPTDFQELLASLKQVPAFAACFALYALLWYYHFQFHRRFGFENLYTIFLNVCLLFLILVYAYPAKFIFAAFFKGVIWREYVEFPNAQGLMLFYSGGVVGIFLLYTLMYLHAYKHREVLGLNDVEVHITRTTIREHQIHVGVGLASMGIALFDPRLSGLIYLLVGPLQGLNGWLSGRAVRSGQIGGV